MGKAWTGKTLTGGLKVTTNLEDFTMKIEVTSTQNILNPEIPTYNRTF